MLPEVLVTVIGCPECGERMEGTWLAGTPVEPCLQECPSCAARFEAARP